MQSKWFVLLIIVLTGIVPAAAQAQEALTPAEICASAVPQPASEPQSFAAPEQVLEAGIDYRAVLCADSGPIYIDLLEEYAPVTVNSFVFLAQQGFYDGTTFHRVLEQFMAQGGDPEGTGMGGPGYQFEDEFVGFLHFDRPGWLAMANAGAGTNGSQFFITTVDTPHLNYAHTIFGEVLEGMENVEAISLRDPATATEPGDTLQTVVIVTDPESVTTTFEALPKATQEEVTGAFLSLTEILPPDVLVLSDDSGVLNTDELVATLPEDVQESYADYFAAHNHEYRATDRIQNPGCDLQNIAFIETGYLLDVYPDAEQAAAALADPALAELYLAEGYTQIESDSAQPVFQRASTSCETDALESVTHWQRGRFVVTAEITLPAEVDVPMDIVLDEFVGIQIFENLLSDILRPEIR